MSNLQDYYGADCKRLRVPIISVASHHDSIEKIVLNAWQNGGSVKEAVNEVLNDKNLTSSIVLEVSRDLEYQREIYTGGVDEKLNSQIQKHNKNLADESGRIKASYEKVALEKQKNEEATGKDLTEKRRDYNHSDYFLRQLRERVEKRLSEIGGKDKLNELLRINELVANTPSESSYQVNENIPSPPLSKKTAKTHMNKTSLESRTGTQEGSESQTPVIATDGPKEKMYLRVAKKIWRILNYKIF